MRNTKTIAIATAIATTLLSASATFADTKSSNIVQAPKFVQTRSGEVQGLPKNHLISLMNSGTLTQAQENALQSAILSDPKVSAAKGRLKRGDNGGFKTVQVGLVKAGTLTQPQEGASPGRSAQLKEARTANGNLKREDNS